jgi:signal transduction histidine kinase
MHNDAIPLASIQSGVRISQVNNRLLQYTRIAWFGLMAFIVIVFAVGMIFWHNDLLQPCATSLEKCSPMQLRPVNLLGLKSPEAALRFYASFYTIEQVSIRLLLLILSVLIYRWRRDDWMALLVSIWLLTIAPPFAELALAQRLLWLVVPLTGIRLIGAVCSTLFLFIFPNGKFTPHWMRWPAAIFTIFAIGMILIPDFSRINETAWSALLLAIQYCFVLYSQVYRYRKVSNTVERQQTKWVLFGIALAAVSLIGTRLWIGLDWNPDAQISSIFYLQVLGFVFHSITIPITLGIAILRYRLFDIDMVLNRTLVYGTLTVMVAGVYALVVFVFNLVIGSKGWSFLPGIIAVSTVATVFQPVRDRVQLFVNHLMYGDRNEPYHVLTRLSERLEGNIEPSMSLPLSVETIAHVLKLPYVAISLKKDDHYETVAAIGKAQERKACFPLTFAGETIGELIASPRTGEETFNSVDHRLLSDLARQIGATAHAVLVSADLERARLHIVEAREEARRRLGSDLHDGIGHQLASLARQSERATNLLEQDATSARDLLSDIKTQLDQTIVQVRKLAHQLYPPELELLGLIGALRERIQSIDGPNLIIRSEIPETLPNLPTAVEAAAYYIALEALTNVSKHAGARSCNLRLEVKGPNGNDSSFVLELEVSDDGRGLSPTSARGLGLLSIQGRAAEVGGTCIIEADPGGGTRVLTRLPYQAQEM